jgi:integrase
MKKPNGYGSVYKLKGRRRRPWVVKRTVGFDDNGRQRFSYEFFATQKEANEALALQNAGLLPQRQKLSLEQVYQEWKTRHYPRLKAGTARGYEIAWQRFYPLHQKFFQDIRTVHLQDIVDAYDGSLSGKQKIKVLATSLYKFAQENDLITKNYAAYIRLPKDAGAKEKQAFTEAEIAVMESRVEAIPHLDALLILIYTGLRVGEFLALTTANINLEESYIQVGEAKTRAGTGRFIPLHPRIIPFVRKYFIEQEGVGYEVSYFRKLCRRALEAAGVRPLTLHECRHTAATRWAKAGLSPLTIQRFMGHRSYTTTADVYTHMDMEHLRLEMEKVQ